MKQSGSGTYVIDDDYTIVTYNDVAEKLYPQLEKGKKCYACLMKRDTPCFNCPVQNNIKGPNSYVDPLRNVIETVDAVDVPLEDGRQGHALVFSTVEAAENTSGISAANDLRLVGIINALSINYTMVFSVDIGSHYTQILRSEKDVLGIHEALKLDNTYENVLRTYVEKNVFEKDKKKVLENLKFTTCVSRLQSVDSFKIHFRAVIHNEIHHYYCKVVKASQNKTIHAFILAFSNEDLDIATTEDESYRFEKKRKLLIVEDNELNRSMLTSILEDTYECLEAANGEEGLKVLQDHYREISCMLLDIQMPVMDGFEVLERIRKDSLLSTIPVIITTGSNHLEDELKCLDLGAADYITKPYNPRAIHARVRNIIKLKESAATISTIETDTLTDAYTEQAFYHHAGHYLELHPQNSLHLCAVNIKGLRLINDIYGEKSGDSLLIYLDKILEKSFPDAIICRSSGDHFILLSSHEDYFDSDRILKICTSFLKEAPITNVVIQFGIYLHIDTSLPLRVLCDRTLTTLHSITNTYSENIAYYDRKISERFLIQQQMESDFDAAIANKEFQVYFQPQVNNRNGQIESAEALVRWIKDGKMISPGDFIPVFEKDGLIVKLDKYMFESVCKIQHDALMNKEKVFPISINLSRASLHHDGIVNTYLAILKKYEISSQLVPIELTESEANYGKSFINAAMKFSEAGFVLHLDDFGSGYSSLTSLNELPFHVLKLDKSLVDNITDEKGKLLIYYVTILAHGLGMQVLAEGVETKEQVTLLQAVECDTIQGFYYYKPMNRKDFRALAGK